MSSLFKIGDNDYTRFITVPSYKVNREKEIEEWTDVTKTKHKEIVRTCVKGDFTMYFDDIDELYAFLDDIENNTTTGNYIHAFVYEQKRRELVESDYFIDFSLQNDKPYYKVKSHSGFTVSIEEK